MDDDARLLACERVYDGSLLKVDKRVVELPDGQPHTLETIQHPGAAAALPFLPDGRVLLIRQYRYAGGGYLLEAPAGKLDPGESPDRCAVREVAEETGWKAARLVSLGSILTTPGFTDERIWLYEAHDLTACKQDLQDGELIELVEMSFEQAVRRATTGEIEDAKTVALLLRSGARRVS